MTWRLGVASVVLLRCGGASADDDLGPLRKLVEIKQSAQSVCWKGDLFPSNSAASGNVSAVAAAKDLLVIGGDEGRAIQVLTKATDGCYAAGAEIQLPADGPAGDEADVEGIARDGDRLYVVGSHSVRRKKVEIGKSATKNRAQLEDVAAQASRRGLFRIKLGGPGGAPTTGAEVEKASLGEFIASHAVLKLFAPLPSKENGIDIEGLAADGEGRLFVGLRGPVLRENFVPVIVVTLEPGKPLSDFTAEVRYVNLGGDGIREIVRVHGGFLILAGPVGDGTPRAKLFCWDGQDGLPDGAKVARATLLGDLPAPAGAKAEGMTLLQDDGPTSDSWDLLVVYDSVEGGAPARFKVRKP